MTAHEVTWKAHGRRSFMIVTLIALVLGLLGAAPANAAAPTLLTASQQNRHVTATWSLPAGAETRELRISRSNVPSPFFGLEGGGYAWNSYFPGGGLTNTSTSFTTPSALEPGTWYVRVGAYDPSDPPDIRWSNILSVVIPSQCSDGADNDGDGKVDHPADPGCSSATDDNETDPPPPPAPPNPSRLSVAVRGVDGLGYVTSSGVKVGVACPSKCKIVSDLFLGDVAPRGFAGSAAALLVGHASKQVGAAGYARFAVKLNKRGRKKLKGARSAELSLRTKVVSGTGARLGQVTRKIRLVRREPVNRAPQFPSPVRFTISSRYVYDDVGRLMGGYTTIVFTSPPTDRNGDPLAYSWKASNGSIRGLGLGAVWTRSMDLGRFAAGKVTLTVRDGRGGSDTFTLDFQRGAG